MPIKPAPCFPIGAYTAATLLRGGWSMPFVVVTDSHTHYTAYAWRVDWT